MKRQLRVTSRYKEDITEFSFTAEKLEQLEWENKHEFRYNEQMYDVISQEWKEGKLVLQCISDEKETELLNKYIKVTRENNSSKKTLASLIQLVLAQFIIPDPILPDPNTILFRTKFPSHSSRLISIAYPIQGPPPRVC